tara:strand:+ start:31223 stop:31462 length:240 start_codon:yes stop_codon:yes gene_type:complete
VIPKRVSKSSTRKEQIATSLIASLVSTNIAKIDGEGERLKQSKQREAGVVNADTIKTTLLLSSITETMKIKRWIGARRD